MDTLIATAVRRAQPSDAAALTALVNRAYAVEAAFVDGDRVAAGEMAELITAGGFLVLEYPHGIAAAVRFQAPGERAELPASAAYFGMLSVHPELQSMGLGRRMVQVVEAMAEASGAAVMRLRMINLREELNRWYKSLGYREVGTSPYTGRGVKRPCHFIERAKPLVAATPVYASRALGAAVI
ncbi:MAG TPA: GNAT family N-acetyltransferase [Kofleriaceae bacterium]|nr:GNAT family N-acetyltransferase [Kofleriaceae bacterium]